MEKTTLTKLLFSISIFLLFLITIRCYTTFKHPQVYSTSDSTDVYYSEEITFLNDCSSCHEQNNPVNDPHLQVYDYPLYEENYSWQYYYIIPWWIDEYYYEEDQEVKPEDKLPAPQRRNFDRRGISPSPATTSPNASGASLSKPSTNEASTETSPQPEPKKRQERRQVVNKESQKSQKSITPIPTRKKKQKDKKETKKEKK